MADEIENQEDNQPDFLSMSDEEVRNFTVPSAASAESVETKVDEVDPNAVAETPEEIAEREAAAKALEQDDPNEAVETPADKKADVVSGTPEAKSDADKTAEVKDGKPAEPKTDAPKEQVTEPVQVDYEAAYKELFAPFKANGRDMQVNNVADARQLMQMGANYNKKMAGLKPSLRYLKMLEGAELLDEGKLNFLIDLSKRDPAAINKLVNDSGIDPLDINVDNAKKYQPGNHGVSDNVVELDDVLADIKDSKSYADTLDVVSSKWDQSSKQEVVTNPQLLRIINDHMELGMYPIIAAAMENERTFGRLKGMSDLQAYQKVGDAIYAAGGFNHLGKGSPQAQEKPAPATPIVVQPKPNKVEDDKLKAARRAASGTKSAASSNAVPSDFNPLSLSDEDFKNFKL